MIPNFCGRLVLAAVLVSNMAAARSRTTSELLSNLATGKLDPSIFFDLESHPEDPRLVIGLRQAFQERTLKRDKQWIALALVHLGEKSDQYLNFLAGYAKQAIEDRSPFAFLYDRDGQLVRGQFTLAFEDWCKANRRDPKEVAGLELLEYPEDVRLLGETRAPEAADLLKEGLRSQNSVIVAFAAEALALMRDTSAIPLIAQACERMPASDSVALAGMLAYYVTPEADRVMEHFIKDPKLREGYRHQALWRFGTELEIRRRKQAAARAAPEHQK